MPANQNSASPKPLTLNRFNASNTAKNKAAHNAELVPGNQYFTIMEPAISSAATVMEEPNQ